MRFASLIVALSLAAPLAAQEPAPQPQEPVPAVQSDQQRQLDDAQCQNSATRASGFVPGSPPPASTVQKGPTGNRVRGAAMGAATGAIVGSAGSGAAAGAIAGGSANRQQRRQASKADSRARAQWEQQQQAWNRAYAACMQQRGYSVP